MARAILASRRPGFAKGLPQLAATWRKHPVAGARLDDFLELTGLDGHPLWALLYPQAAGFRLLMTLVTDYGFPFPIWSALQVRNRLVLRARFARGDTLDLSAEVTEARSLDKGTEIDVACAAQRGGTTVWESLTTFYYRGREGAPHSAAAPPAAPVVNGAAMAQWVPASGARLRFARLTGDYNGIHLSDWYARLFGFRGAFHHPQRTLGQCLARLARVRPQLPVSLDSWLKGPVYYGAKVSMRAGSGGSEFGLFVEGDERPAIIGRLTAGA